jgi:HAD superfamily hydrolase (TIGR01549 family)
MPRTTERAIVFDVDGTLVLCDSTNDAFATILIRHGVCSERPQLSREITAANSDWALIEALVPERARAAAYEEILAANVAAARSSKCHPGIAPMLEALRRDYRLFILSGRDQASIQVILEQHRLAEYFEAIAAAGPDALEKPDPRSFHALLSRHGVAVAAATYIGDKDVDAELAQRAGSAFVGVAWYRNRLHVDCTRVTAPAELPEAVAQAYRTSSAAV